MKLRDLQNKSNLTNNYIPDDKEQLTLQEQTNSLAKTMKRDFFQKGDKKKVQTDFNMQSMVKLQTDIILDDDNENDD